MCKTGFRNKDIEDIKKVLPINEESNFAFTSIYNVVTNLKCKGRNCRHTGKQLHVHSFNNAQNAMCFFYRHLCCVQALVSDYYKI